MNSTTVSHYHAVPLSYYSQSLFDDELISSSPNLFTNTSLLEPVCTIVSEILGEIFLLVVCAKHLKVLRLITHNQLLRKCSHIVWIIYNEITYTLRATQDIVLGIICKAMFLKVKQFVSLSSHSGGENNGY